MEKTIVSTESAPKAIGPYSQAVLVQNPSQTLYCSGQVGLDPNTQKLVEGGVEAETLCALKNLVAVVGAAGMSMANIVRCTIYLTDMANYKAVNAIYAEYFEGHPPARVAFAVSALPAGAQVEIDAVAVA